MPIKDISHAKPGNPFIEGIINDALNYDHIVIDGFAGFGGVTEGFMRTGKYKVIACINHWDKAIDTHEANHPDCLHIEEDFRTADLSLLKYMVEKIRSLKSIQVHLWLSLECTNFSNAKGGMPRDGDSRTLADFVDRYVEILKPEVIWIENVKEFLLWGPMIPKEVNGTCPLVFNRKKNTVGPWMIPNPLRKGEDFKRWRNLIESFGYDSEYRMLNAADYGVPQHRIRLFMQFTRKGMPAFFPKPTHHKSGLHGLPKWKAIRTCLDLEDEGTDLLSFKNGKPRIKSAKTIQRLMTGCVKHVLNGQEFFINSYYGDNKNNGPHPGKSINDTSKTLIGRNHLALIKAKLVDYYFGNGYNIPDSQAAGVSGTKDGASVHTVQFVSEFRNYGEADTVTKPSKAVVTKDKFSLDTVQHIMQNYSDNDSVKNYSIAQQSRAITSTGGNANLVSSLFVMDTQFNNEAHALKETAHTVTSNRKHYYIVNAAWFEGHVKHIDQESATIIARQDKMPQYLVVTETGELAIEVYPHDPPHYRAMKKFMAANGIISIKMRMLKETELLKIQDLPADYKLTSSSTDNKKMIGNAVPPKVVEALANAYDDGYREFNEQLKAA